MKPDNLLPIEEIAKELEEIQNYLQNDQVCEGDMLVERGTYLCCYLARTAKMLADVKYYQDDLMLQATKKAINEGYTEKLSPSVLKDFIKNACKNINYYVSLVDRINRGITHEIDLIRSFISREKEERRMANYGS